MEQLDICTNAKEIKRQVTAAKRDCWFSVTGNFVFTKNVLSWQRKLSPLESQPRLSRETLVASLLQYVVKPKSSNKFSLNLELQHNIMAIKFGYTPPEGFPERRDEYFEKYYALVLKNAPRSKDFAMHELFDLDFKSDEHKWYNEVTFDIRKSLVEDGFLRFASSSNIYLTLTEKGKSKQDELNKSNFIDLVDYVLKQLFEQREKTVYFQSLKNLDGRQLPLLKRDRVVIQLKGLIDFKEYRVWITKKGEKAIEKGGYESYKNWKEQKSKTPKNINKKVVKIKGDNYGQLLQDSHLEKSPTTIEVNKIQTSKEAKSIIEKLSDNKLISGIILLIIAIILSYYGIKH